jgi:hypothetical protein
MTAQGFADIEHLSQEIGKLCACYDRILFDTNIPLKISYNDTIITLTSQTLNRNGLAKLAERLDWFNRLMGYFPLVYAIKEVGNELSKTLQLFRNAEKYFVSNRRLVSEYGNSMAELRKGKNSLVSLIGRIEKRAEKLSPAPGNDKAVVAGISGLLSKIWAERGACRKKQGPPSETDYLIVAEAFYHKILGRRTAIISNDHDIRDIAYFGAQEILHGKLAPRNGFLAKIRGNRPFLPIHYIATAAGVLVPMVTIEEVPAVLNASKSRLTMQAQRIEAGFNSPSAGYRKAAGSR